MVTVIKDVGSVTSPMELIGKSTDTKPTGNIDGRPIINGSTFIEMDTGEVYWFDEAAGEWIK